MMFPTHFLFGFSIAILSINLLHTPDYLTEYIYLFCILGSIFPDLDLFIGQHRKSLHYPAIGFLILVWSISLILYSETAILVILFIFCFWIHALLDVIGGGLSRTPWDNANSPTVFNHYRKRWIKQDDVKPALKYDGSPLDLTLSMILAIFVYTMTQSTYITYILLIMLFIGLIYTVTRKYLIQIEPYLAELPIIGDFITSLHGQELEENTNS